MQKWSVAILYLACMTVAYDGHAAPKKKIQKPPECDSALLSDRSLRITENFKSDEAIEMMSVTGRWAWKLQDFKARAGKIVSLKRWNAKVPIEFEYLTLAGFPGDDQEMCMKLYSMSEKSLFLEIGKQKVPGDQRDNLKTVEVGALQIRMKSGRKLRIYFSSADKLFVTRERIDRNFAALMRKEEFVLEDVSDVQFFHSHPDGDPDLSGEGGDVDFASEFRDEMRRLGISAPFHIYSVAKVDDELIMAHLGLNP
jgi:hypothetical protein